MNASVRTASLLATLTVLAAAAQAGEIYNNFGPGNSFGGTGLILQGPDVNTIGDVDQAARFTTNGSFHESIAVAAGIGVSGPQPNGAGDLAVGIYTDAGAAGPGTLLASETLSLGTFGDQIATATFASLTLDPNTNYWLVLDSRTTFDGSWVENDQGATGVSAGRTNGGPWAFHGPSTDLFAFRVLSRVETVPEPASFAALGLGAVALVRRRRRKG